MKIKREFRIPSIDQIYRNPAAYQNQSKALQNHQAEEIVCKTKKLIQLTTEEIYNFCFFSESAERYILKAIKAKQCFEERNTLLSSSETVELMMTIALKIAKAAIVFYKDEALGKINKLDRKTKAIQTKFSKKMPFEDVFSLAESTLEATDAILSFVIKKHVKKIASRDFPNTCSLQ